MAEKKFVPIWCTSTSLHVNQLFIFSCLLWCNPPRIFSLICMVSLQKISVFADASHWTAVLHGLGHTQSAEVQEQHVFKKRRGELRSHVWNYHVLAFAITWKRVIYFRFTGCRNSCRAITNRLYLIVVLQEMVYIHQKTSILDTRTSDKRYFFVDSG